MRVSIVCLIVFTVLISCKKEKDSKYFQDFVECGQSQNLDSTATSAKLIGTWTWKKQSVSYTDKFRNADKNIKVTFNANSTFSLTEDSNVIMQGSWKVVDYGIYYGLAINQYSEYLGGGIYFCGSELLFANRYLDGVDNVFEK